MPEANQRTRIRTDQLVTLIGVFVPLIGTVVAMGMVWQKQATWRDVFILLGMYVATGLGITVGFHRMLTHHSFQAHPAVRCVLLALGCMAGHTDPIRWTAIHVQHHAHADKADDPHTPLQGLFHAHVGWIYDGIDPHPELYARWLLKDRMAIFFQRTFVGWLALGYIVPFLLGGWTGLLWGGLVRMFLSHHITWSVNSICHMFGKRPFATHDQSTNNGWIGLLALGEGWHNNHHAFPRSAFHGLYWWQIDLSAYLIVILEKLGMIWNVQRASPAAQVAKRVKQDSFVN